MKTLLPPLPVCLAHKVGICCLSSFFLSNGLHLTLDPSIPGGSAPIFRGGDASTSTASPTSKTGPTDGDIEMEDDFEMEDGTGTGPTPDSPSSIARAVSSEELEAFQDGLFDELLALEASEQSVQDEQKKLEADKTAFELTRGLEEKRLNELRKLLDQQAEKLEARNAQLKDLEDKVNEARARLKEEQETHGVATAQQVEDLKNREAKFLHELCVVNKDAARHEEDKREFQAERQNFLKKVEEQTAKFEAALAELESSKEKLREKEKYLSSKTDECERLYASVEQSTYQGSKGRRFTKKRKSEEGDKTKEMPKVENIEEEDDKNKDEDAVPMFGSMNLLKTYSRKETE